MRTYHDYGVGLSLEDNVPVLMLIKSVRLISFVDVRKSDHVRPHIQKPQVG